ncbi:hypothetical protein M0R72_16140 [Candidatus Pacearchaeota archaeon]|nr:hypothetical protein [Candidatus Pacearchaeota archaeon]
MQIENGSPEVRKIKDVEFGSTIVYDNTIYIVVSSPSESPKGMVLLVDISSGYGRYLPWETGVPIVPYKAVRCSE